jgi:hypothetical protein
MADSACYDMHLDERTPHAAAAATITAP